MNIETSEFSVTRNQLFFIFLKDIIRRRWFVFILIVLVSLSALDAGVASVIILILFSWTVYLAALTISSFLRTEPKKNQFQYQTRTCRIDHESISMLYQDGSFSKYKFTLIRRLVESSGYYLLFLAKNHYLYLSKKAILNQNDIKILETLIKVKINK